jgi:hypothetical protein
MTPHSYQHCGFCSSLKLSCLLRTFSRYPCVLCAALACSEEYLSGVEAAEQVTRQLLAVYARHGVTPLVETEVTSESELEQLQQLLREVMPGAAGTAGPTGGGGSAPP